MIFSKRCVEISAQLRWVTATRGFVERPQFSIASARSFRGTTNISSRYHLLYFVSFTLASHALKERNSQ